MWRRAVPRRGNEPSNRPLHAPPRRRPPQYAAAPARPAATARIAPAEPGRERAKDRWQPAMPSCRTSSLHPGVGQLRLQRLIGRRHRLFGAAALLPIMAVAIAIAVSVAIAVADVELGDDGADQRRARELQALDGGANKLGPHLAGADNEDRRRNREVPSRSAALGGSGPDAMNARFGVSVCCSNSGGSQAPVR